MMGNSINNSVPLSERILRKCLVETLLASLERHDAFSSKYSRVLSVELYFILEPCLSIDHIFMQHLQKRLMAIKGWEDNS